MSKIKAIGIIFLNRRLDNKFVTWTNPRGFFNENINVLTKEGKENFRMEALKFADGCITQLDNLNSLSSEKIVKRAIIWNFNGYYPPKNKRKGWNDDRFLEFKTKLDKEQSKLEFLSRYGRWFSNFSSTLELIEQLKERVTEFPYINKAWDLGFIGDPSHRAPEWDYEDREGVTHQLFFNKFRDAGYDVGLTIRDKWAIYSPAKDVSWYMKRIQTDNQTVVDTNLKIERSNRLWGNKTFYLDDFNMSKNIHNRIGELHPDKLFVVEFLKEVHDNLIPYHTNPNQVDGFYDASRGTTKSKLKTAIDNNNFIGVNCWYNSLELSLLKDILDGN